MTTIGGSAAVELVDQQHRRAVRVRLERLQKRPLDQEAFAEDAVADRLFRLAGSFSQPDFDHLPLVVPFVDRGGGIEAFVTLQPHQLAAERGGNDFRDFGLADARRAFDKQRPAHPEREKKRGREAALGDVIPAREQRERVVNRGWQLGFH